MKKLVVIDDEYLTIEGIRVMLKRIGADYEMAGSASDGQMALELIENVHPDVVFIDIRMPGLSGLEVIEHFYKKYPDMIFVLVSAYKEFEYARKNGAGSPQLYRQAGNYGQTEGYPGKDR